MAQLKCLDCGVVADSRRVDKELEIRVTEELCSGCDLDCGCEYDRSDEYVTNRRFECIHCGYSSSNPDEVHEIYDPDEDEDCPGCGDEDCDCSGVEPPELDSDSFQALEQSLQGLRG